jgi:hypothetical protein
MKRPDNLYIDIWANKLAADATSLLAWLACLACLLAYITSVDAQMRFSKTRFGLGSSSNGK